MVVTVGPQQLPHLDGENMITVIRTILPDLPDGVLDDGAGAVEAVVHIPEQLVLLLELQPDVDGEGLEGADLALQLALHLLVLILQGFVTHEGRALGRGVPVRPVGHNALQAPEIITTILCVKVT